MTELSVAIRNAVIVDGTGRDRFSGDIGILGDRIVAVGRVDGRASHEVDANGQVVSPGFIDPHTHYDPHLCWDGLASPSIEHGVTTLIAGNCGLSLAPVRKEGVAKIVSLFGVVEDISQRTFTSGVPFDWQSVSEYLNRIRGTLGPNVGMLVGHAALRLFVMGEDAQRRSASDREIGEMVEILGSAIESGAFGLSFTYAHLDELGQQLPSMFSDVKERRALVRKMGEVGRGIVQLTPTMASPQQIMDMFDECGQLSLDTGVAFSVAPIMHTPGQGNLWLRMLVKLDSWCARGAKLFGQTQVRPFDVSFRLSESSLALSKGPSWSKILNGPLADRFTAFRDAAVRDVLEAELAKLGRFVSHMALKSSDAPKNQSYIGKTIVSIAHEEKRRVVDVILDIALADELTSDFEIVNFIHADPEIVPVILGHPNLCIGAGDAGAHVSQFAGAGDTTYFLERFVRELGLFSLEHGVRRLTSDIAEKWGLRERGIIREAFFADLVIFDPTRVARGREVRVGDLPDGGTRLVRRPQGITEVFVNGQSILERGVYSPTRPGRIV